MKIRFNDGKEKQVITNPVEQKLFRGGVATGWILNVSIASITAEEADGLLTTDNISSITLLNDAGDEMCKILGYEKISALTVRHNDTQSVAEIQFSKGV